MAEPENKTSLRSPKPGGLFSPLKFWVSLKVPKRIELGKSIVANGGQLVEQEFQADYCLVNPVKITSSTARCYDFKFVLDCIHVNELQGPNDYLVSTQSHEGRAVGSAVLPRKATRVPFTAEDEQILDRWIIPFRQSGGKWMGNQIYQQLARQHPQHTYQSWRDRSIRRFQDKPIRPAVADAALDIEEEEPALDHDRPSKRRRVHDSPQVTFTEDKATSSNVAKPPQLNRVEPNLDTRPDQFKDLQSGHQQQPSTDGTLEKSSLSTGRGIQNVLVPRDSSPTVPQDQVSNYRRLRKPAEEPGSDTDLQEEQSEDVETDPRSARRQNLRTRRFSRTAVGNQGFTADEARRLYRAVPEICNTTPKRLESCWEAVAASWTGHTADQWRTYYEHAIVPEYKRRNGLESDLELQQHVKDLLSREQDAATPEIKREPTPDLRSPEEKQVDREAKRAQIEHDIALSDTSESQPPVLNNVLETEYETIVNPLGTFSAIEPLSPVASRLAVQANEGRKRASQNTSSTQSNSQNAPGDDVTILSPKKKLFGQTLTSSQPAYPSTHENQPAEQDPSVQHPFTRGTTANSNVVSSSSASVPAAQKPPQSFQLPPVSASTSQESAMYDTATQSQKVMRQNEGDGMFTAHRTVEQEEGGFNGLNIDLIGDDGLDRNDAPSETGLSDTGSEYVAFDTAPERTQLWETESNAQAAEEVEHDDDKSGDAQQMAIGIKPPTPLRRRNSPDKAMKDDIDSESGDESRPDANEDRNKLKAAANVASRVETQALFRHADEHEVSEFDLPPPDGGWDALGLETLEDDEQDFDTPLQTVEVLEAKILKRAVSRSLSETTSHSGSERKVQFRTTIVSALAQPVTPADDDDETTSETVHESTTSDPVSNFAKTSNVVRANSQRSSNTNSVPRVQASSSGYAGLDKFGSQNPLHVWIETQREQHSELPSLVYDRLASTAVQATSFHKISLATALLQALVSAFHESELERCERYSRTGKPFTSREKLSELDAKSLIPDSVMGFWTRTDDNALLSGTSASVRRVEAKHTRALVEERRKWLMRKFQLNERGPGTKSVKPSNEKKAIMPDRRRKR